jgi:hypothetical protein
LAGRQTFFSFFSGFHVTVLSVAIRALNAASRPNYCISNIKGTSVFLTVFIVNDFKPGINQFMQKDWRKYEMAKL